MADAFSGNSAESAGEDSLREKWGRENCVHFLKSPPPGGWSAYGQPNDAVHQAYRALPGTLASKARCVL